MVRQADFWKTRLKEWTTLEKPDRISEILFGLIMVLTCTGTISVSNAGRQEVNGLLWAALGCNLAWGLVDAIMYLMDESVVRARKVTQLRKIKEVGYVDASREIVRNNISPLISELMDDDEIDRLSEKLRQLPEPVIEHPLTFKDFLIAGQIFLLVFLSTFPAALPFLLFNNVVMAMRISNGTGLILLFALGFTLGSYSGLRPFRTALVYTAIGVGLVVLTILLGG